MRVLVTRPEVAGRRTAQRLKDMGHEPVSFPLFEAHHLDLSSADFPSSLPGGLVFTSAEAVRALDKVPAIADRFGDIPVFAVGKATARAACGAGFRTIKVASGYGADLAALIKTNHRASSAPLLYFAGEPRSPSLEEGLEEAGIPVHVALTYRMEPVAHSTSRLEAALADDPIILLYSREAARRFLHLLGNRKASGRLRFVCLSPAIAATLPSDQGHEIRTAPEPTEESLLSLLQDN